MFVYAIVHLTFRAPKIVVRTCVYTNAYLAVNYCLSIYKNIYTHKVRFFNGKYLQYYLRRRVTIDTFGKTDN